MEFQKKKFIRHLDNIILNFTKRTNELASCVSLYAKERSSQKIQDLFYRFRLDSWIIRAGGKFNASRHLTSWVRYAHTALYRKSAGRNDRNCKELINLFTYPLINFKPAFTLAEVLITLGIIGVVAAITIPILISNYQKKQLETQIKATYSTIQQTLRYAEDEDISYNSVLVNDDASLINFYNNFLAKHLKVEQITINKKPDIDKEVYTIYYQSGNKYGDIGRKNIGLTIAKGAVIYISVAYAESVKNRYGIDSNENTLIFFFDANGKSKPNVMGNDVQLAAWTEKGLVPGGYSLTQEEIDVSCFHQQGHACLSKIIKDNWKIPDKVWKRKVRYRE